MAVHSDKFHRFAVKNKLSALRGKLSYSEALFYFIPVTADDHPVHYRIIQTPESGLRQLQTAIKFPAFDFGFIFNVIVKNQLNLAVSPGIRTADTNIPAAVIFCRYQYFREIFFRNAADSDIPVKSPVGKEIKLRLHVFIVTVVKTDSQLMFPFISGIKAEFFRQIGDLHLADTFIIPENFCRYSGSVNGKFHHAADPYRAPVKGKSPLAAPRWNQIKTSGYDHHIIQHGIGSRQMIDEKTEIPHPIKRYCFTHLKFPFYKLRISVGKFIPNIPPETPGGSIVHFAECLAEVVTVGKTSGSSNIIQRQSAVF